MQQPQPGFNSPTSESAAEYLSHHTTAILSNKLLIVNRGVYRRPDFPKCVCSQLKSVGTVNYRHNLTYLDTDRNVHPMYQKRVYRDAFYTVKREQSMVRFSVHAYMDSLREDPKMSGAYDVFYANKECFIAATRLPRNAACLLWRRPHARERNRNLCRAAFKKFCIKHGSYTFVFTTDACLKKRNLKTKVSLPVAQGLS
ncbi:uncharacterized protein LOC119180091 isoform X2 [Rhipicephalus microplus]|uniref:uncharacterized protein LOC119180091 isoform X2 n=1 Tax=Rhipicephalus microplus TaxID=6941 RepID=UPI003F6B8A25